jgi:hypothetical protein
MSMFTLPHPIVMTKVDQQRRDALLAEADHDRLGRLVQTDAKRLPRRVDLATIAGIVLALALPFVASHRG